MFAVTAAVFQDYAGILQISTLSYSVNRGVSVDINQGNSQLHSWLPNMWVQLSHSRGHHLWFRILQDSFRFSPGSQLLWCCVFLNLSSTFKMKTTVWVLPSGFHVSPSLQAWAKACRRKTTCKHPALVSWYPRVQLNLPVKEGCMSTAVKPTNCVRWKAQGNYTEKKKTTRNNKD